MYIYSIYVLEGFSIFSISPHTQSIFHLNFESIIPVDIHSVENLKVLKLQNEKDDPQSFLVFATPKELWCIRLRPRPSIPELVRIKKLLKGKHNIGRAEERRGIRRDSRRAFPLPSFFLMPKGAKRDFQSS